MLNEYFCDSCGRKLDEDDEGTVVWGGDNVCRYCLLDNYKRCSSCGEYFSKDQLKGDPPQYCRYCYTEEHGDDLAETEPEEIEDETPKPSPEVKKASPARKKSSKYDESGLRILNKVLTSCAEDCETIIIPEGVETIRNAVFRKCKNLKKVVCPGSLRTIRKEAFAYSTVIEVVLSEGLEKIGERAFASCPRLESISIPDSVELINREAFLDCKNLRSVVFGNGLIDIQDNAFRGCVSLETIKLPDSLKRVGTHSFAWCSALKEISFPEGLLSIELFAFQDCTSLEAVHFPDSLLLIDFVAFSNCRKLRKVNLGELTGYDGSAFDNGVKVAGGKKINVSEKQAIKGVVESQIKSARRQSNNKKSSPADQKETGPALKSTETEPEKKDKDTTAEKTAKNKTEKTTEEKTPVAKKKPIKRHVWKGTFPVVTRNELLSSMDKAKYKGVHDVRKGYEWISPRGLWAMKIPAGFTYTMDHTIQRELSKTPEGVAVKCDAQIRMTEYAGSSWASKEHFGPVDILITPTLGTLDVKSISGDLNQEHTMTAISNYLNEHGFDLESGAFKYTSEIAIWYKATVERVGSKEHPLMMFCVFCSGTTMVTGGLVVFEKEITQELNALVSEMIKSITKVPQTKDMDEFIPDVLPDVFSLRFAAHKELRTRDGIRMPVPDGFKGAIDTDGKIGPRICSIIPEKLAFWNGTSDSSYIPLDISMMGINSDDIKAGPKQAGKIAEQVIRQAAPLGVFSMNGPLYLARQTEKDTVLYQEWSDYGVTDGLALRVIAIVNNKMRVCTFRMFFQKPIERSYYNLMLHEAGAMVVTYFQHMQLEGEELFDHGRGWAKPVSAANDLSPYSEHLELVSSVLYTTARSADFRAMPIHKLIRESGNEKKEAYALMAVEEGYDLDQRAKEIAQVFRLNADLFDPYHDTEAMIRLGMIKEAHSVHALRSLAWTVAALAENEKKEYDQFTFDELKQIGEDIRRAGWLSYYVNDAEGRCRGLCAHEDWHVFYVPDHYLTSGTRKSQDLRFLCGKENRGGSTISFSVPGMGSSLSDEKERIDSIISRNEETLTSLEGLRSDLEDMLPVMETIFEGFMKDRDRSKELKGSLADILAAWCALSIAAKEAFYSEEAADTPEANAALDEPLKRPEDELTDKTNSVPEKVENVTETNSKSDKSEEIINDSGMKRSNAQSWLAVGDGEHEFRMFGFDGNGTFVHFEIRNIQSNKVLGTGESELNLEQIKPEQGINVVTDYEISDLKCWPGERFSFNWIVYLAGRGIQKKELSIKVTLGLKEINQKEKQIKQKEAIGHIVKKPVGRIEGYDELFPFYDIIKFKQGDYSLSSGFKNVTIIEGVLWIEKKAFWMSNLTSVICATTLKTISDRAFADSEDLYEIILNEGLEEIGRCVFENCPKLKQIYLPDSLKSVDQLAFINNEIDYEFRNDFPNDKDKDYSLITLYLSGKLARHLAKNRKYGQDTAVVAKDFMIDGVFYKTIEKYTEKYEAEGRVRRAQEEKRLAEERQKEADREKTISERKQEAIQNDKEWERADLRKQIAKLKQERSEIRGIFNYKKRKAIQKQIDELKEKLLKI